ncbi:hypothetical protein CEUSTIGMA_g9343.t1 [Chlamydomonas eustigma]|uniref:Uncharacterized protein n=1 Tax=Chlamydomonas eustigma TaxID=1157962 RepID=A0A250XFQ7_9CHLO|nr:hypothetical protein CEUSTIGMA_g9343.t1 [Chlamydomonas eustigma]|eukprot:GAX81915.1 hypothetical protein CEUSTIGMA_g9343.t1 [Chlamydomonas eustigma]
MAHKPCLSTCLEEEPNQIEEVSNTFTPQILRQSASSSRMSYSDGRKLTSELGSRSVKLPSVRSIHNSYASSLKQVEALLLTAKKDTGGFEGSATTAKNLASDESTSNDEAPFPNPGYQGSGASSHEGDPLSRTVTGSPAFMKHQLRPPQTLVGYSLTPYIMQNGASCYGAGASAEYSSASLIECGTPGRVLNNVSDSQLRHAKPPGNNVDLERGSILGGDDEVEEGADLEPDSYSEKRAEAQTIREGIMIAASFSRGFFMKPDKTSSHQVEAAQWNLALLMRAGHSVSHDYDGKSHKIPQYIVSNLSSAGIISKGVSTTRGIRHLGTARLYSSRFRPYMPDLV